MEKVIEVIQGDKGKVYTYKGKFAPYSAALTIGEIIQGLPDPKTARMCLTDIMATLSEYESEKEAGRIAHLPFSSGRLLTVSGGHTTLTATDRNEKHIKVSGKMCIFECSAEEAARHDKEADVFIKQFEGRATE